MAWSQTRPLPVFDGSTDPEQFIVQFSEQVPDSQKMETLDSAFRATVAQWWNGHKKYMHSWEAFQKSLCLRFRDQPQEVQSRFNGKTSPQGHLEQCYEAWKHVPREEWVHRFVHTLEPIAKNGYAEVELLHGTVSWDILLIVLCSHFLLMRFVMF